jgi:hypothetical protein
VGDLSYSSNALDTLTKFHRKNYIVYVEGDDDVIFWEKILQRFGMKNFELKVAGGSNEIDKYIKSIISDNVDIIVARDCDYNDVLGTQYFHNRIIYTYGYSIENTMYCPRNIQYIVSLFAKRSVSIERETTEWIDSFSDSVKTLIYIDIVNHKYKKGIKVIPDTCLPFTENKKSHNISNTKIEDYTRNLYNNFTPSEISEINNLSISISKENFFLIRGHFLTHAIINFIKYNVKNICNRDITLPLENLYALLISNFEKMCSNRKDMLYLKIKINQLLSDN